MRFLLHGQLGPEVAAKLAELGHKSVVPADLKLAANATANEIVEACRAGQYELMTADGGFLDAVLPTSGRRDVFNRVVVYLHDAHDKQIESVARLFERYKRLTAGRLYTVTAGRVKVRQLPSNVAAAV